MSVLLLFVLILGRHGEELLDAVDIIRHLITCWQTMPRTCWDSTTGHCAVTTDVLWWYTFRVLDVNLEVVLRGCYVRLRIDDAARQKSRSQMTEEQCISWSTDVRGLSPARRHSYNNNIWQTQRIMQNEEEMSTSAKSQKCRKIQKLWSLYSKQR